MTDINADDIKIYTLNVAMQHNKYTVFMLHVGGFRTSRSECDAGAAASR